MPVLLEKLTFNEITTINRNEEKMGDLSEMRRDFYPAFREYVQKVKADSEQEIRQDPTSVKATSSVSEIKKVTRLGANIFDRRQRKVMSMAARAAGGSKVDTARLTNEEKEFYDALVEEVRAFKSLAMDGERISTRRAVVVSPCALPPTSVEVAGGKVEGTAYETGAKLVDAPANPSLGEASAQTLVLVRVLEDIPAFAGPTRQYHLSKEEVVFLPASIGCALIRNGKAVEIQTGRA